MEILLLGKEPVSQDQRAGPDAKYEPEFEEMQAEIDKLASPSATEGADWKKVSALTQTILAEKSKDLLVASYFAVSQIYLNRIQGLKTGLVVYHDLIETFWEDLFPVKKRMKGRINALEWWIEKTEIALSRMNPETISAELKDEIDRHLSGIETLLGKYLPEPVSIRPVIRAIEAFKVAVPEKKPEEAQKDVSRQEEVTAKPATPPPQVPQTAISEPKIPVPGKIAVDSAENAEKALESGFSIIGKAAHYLFENDAKNPSGYKFTRMAAWSSVSGLPLTTDGRKTIIPPPDIQFSNTVKELLSKGDYKNLLEVSEPNVSQYIFWLDLNRYVSDALSGLGDAYEKAKETVCRETAFFLQMFPELPEFLFADGTPFADNDTKAWIKEIAFGNMPELSVSMPSAAQGTAGGSPDGMGDALQKAQDLVKKKKLKEAVELLQNHLNTSLTGREKLLWRMGLSRLLIANKRQQIAVPHLEKILQDIEQHKLEEWDPRLALDGFTTVLSGYQNHPDPEIKKRAGEVLHKIARLDAPTALSLGK